MPLDPSIILGGVNTSDVIAKTQANIVQQQAARQQLQLQQYSVAQAKQNFEDQRNMRAAWMQAKGDPTLTKQIAIHLGVSQNALNAWDAQQLDIQTKQAALKKSQAETAGLDQKNLTDRHHTQWEQGSQLDGITDPAEFESKKKALVTKWYNDGIATLDEANDYLGKNQDQLKQAIYTYRTLNDDKIKSDITKNTAEAESATATAAKNKAEMPGVESDNAKKAADALQTNTKQWASKLETAYQQAGGGVAGASAVEKMRQSAPSEVQEFLPTGAQVASVAGHKDAYGNDLAVSAIRNAGETAAERSQREAQEAQFRQTKENEDRNYKLRQQEAAASQTMARATLAMHQQGMEDREVQQLSAPFTKIVTNAQNQLMNIDNAIRDLSSSNGAVQFLGVIGGVKSDVAGGGVRVTQADINGVLHNRLGAGYATTMQQFATGKPISQSQVEALRGAMMDLKAIVIGRANDAANAMQDISNAPNQAVRRGKADWYIRNKFGMEGTQPGSPAQQSQRPNAAPAGAPGRNRGSF